MNNKIYPGKYTISLINEFNEVEKTITGTNLVLNNLLDRMDTNKFGQLFGSAFIGNGRNHNDGVYEKMFYHDSDVLASQDGNTVTSTGSFFTSGMVGETIHFDSEEFEINTSQHDCTITEFISDTEVNVNTTANLHNKKFTVWKTSLTELRSRIITETYFDSDFVRTIKVEHSAIDNPGYDKITYTFTWTGKRKYEDDETIYVDEIGVGTAHNNLSAMFFINDIDSPNEPFVVPPNYTLVIVYQISEYFDLRAGIWHNTDIEIDGANDNLDDNQPKTAITHTPPILTIMSSPSVQYVSEPSFGGTVASGSNDSRSLRVTGHSVSNLRIVSNYPHSGESHNIKTDYTTYKNHTDYPQEWKLIRDFEVSGFASTSLPQILKTIQIGNVITAWQHWFQYDFGDSLDIETVKNSEDRLYFTIEWNWGRVLPDSDEII